MFPHGVNPPAGPQIAYDIVVATYTADEPLASAEKVKFQALLTYANGIGENRRANVAAKGQPSDDLISAYEALLLVTASALEKYQGNVCKEATMPTSIANGMIDEALIHGRSWKSMLMK